MVTLKRTNASDADFIQLVKHLDADLAVLDGEDFGFFAQFNQLDKIKHAIVAYVENRPIGCGAMKQFSEDAMEIKRMFTEPEFRGKGVASMILTDLEKWAAELSYSRCVLETGKDQFDANALYRKAGYQVIPNYDQYIGLDGSVCYGKSMK